MEIHVLVQSSRGRNSVRRPAGVQSHSIDIARRASGFGSSIRRGERTFLTLAACFCSDLYTEAALFSLAVESVEMEIAGQFGTEGEPAL